jgi:hypothetical protein
MKDVSALPQWAGTQWVQVDYHDKQVSSLEYKLYCETNHLLQSVKECAVKVQTTYTDLDLRTIQQSPEYALHSRINHCVKPTEPNSRAPRSAYLHPLNYSTLNPQLRDQSRILRHKLTDVYY